MPATNPATKQTATAAKVEKKADKPAAAAGGAAADKKVPVPETVLKRRKTTAQKLEQAQKSKIAARKKHTATRKLIFKRAEKYAHEYLLRERSLVRFRRQAKNTGSFYVEAEAKVAFVVRIRGTNGLHPKPRKILQLLRLRQINNGTFVRLNKATLEMLKLVEPYIAFGTPNLKTVKELIYKRGYAKVHHQRIGLTSNSIVEKALGKYNIICVEDLIHEIYTVGPHFKEATRFLWPFKLQPPRGGWNQVNRHYNDGGDFGNREDKINALVQSMN